MRTFVFALWCVLLVGAGSSSTAFAATLAEAEAMLLAGKYEECIRTADAALQGGAFDETWHLLKAESERRLGKYDEALGTLNSALHRFNWSVRLRWKAMQICPFTDEADTLLRRAEEIGALVQNSPWRYVDTENLLALGEFVLSQGADAKQVQDAFYQRAKRNNPRARNPQLAIGNLALEKRDFALAAETFQAALDSLKEAGAKSQEDVDLLLGLALAYAESDGRRFEEFLQRAHRANPRHAEVLIALADRLIDGEKYDEAIVRLNQVLETNPSEPDAWALRSVIAHLQGDDAESDRLRGQALEKWKDNPRVDFLIGRKLSQKYRFLEGAAAQRQALEFNPTYLPSKKQLSQDLLRLGMADEGWRLADEVYQADAYDVVSYNLIMLREAMEKFAELTPPGFSIRMDAREAAIYGDEVVKLLQAARDTLCEKYDQPLDRTIYVEIFPKPADFAVRTFGLPAAGGYLGVCFGDVITANSPASQDIRPVNWESVLWHEFAHVVTLNKTRNRMPRWLSEGISVYEERARDPSWGERMTPGYRQLILEGRFHPIGDLSAAFLNPGGNLLFSYYESSLAVEFLIDTYGFPSLLLVLDDLGAGLGVNEAIDRRMAPLPEIEDKFAAFLRAKAEAFGPEVDWSPADLASLASAPDAADQLVAWAEENQQHFAGLKTSADLLVKMNRPQAALPLLERAAELIGDDPGPDGVWLRLAGVRRTLNDEVGEYAALRRAAEVDSAVAAGLLRLIEIDLSRQNWEQVRADGLRLLAIKPLIPQPHAALAEAAEHLNDPETAVQALQALLSFDPPDLAGAHYRLAVQLELAGDRDAAKRHVLISLEQAPRYRDALALLLRLSDPDQEPASAGF